MTPAVRFLPLTGHVPVVVIVAVLTAIVVPAFAQTAPAAAAATAEDSLARLIKEYEAQRSLIERPFFTAYAQRLTALRETLEKRRDPGAAAVVTELSAVQAKLNRSEAAGAPPTAIPAPESPRLTPLELPGRKATLTGGASSVGDENSPVNFSSKDSAAEWSLPALPPGRYRLLWKIACEVGAGATVRLSIDGQPPRTLEVQPTSASGDAVIANLGEFTASTPPTWVRVEVLSLPGRPRKIGPSFSLGKVVFIPPGVTMPGL